MKALVSGHLVIASCLHVKRDGQYSQEGGMISFDFRNYQLIKLNKLSTHNVTQRQVYNFYSLNFPLILDLPYVEHGHLSKTFLV